MGRKRSPARDNAKYLWLNDPGRPLKEIAAEIGVSEEQVRKWKSVDRWDKNKVTLPKKKSNVTIPKYTAKKMVESVGKNAELGEAEKDFCLFFVNCRNAAQAYRDAYNYEGKYANRLGWQVLQRADVKKEIEYLLTIKRTAIIMSEEDIVEKYMRIAFADISNILEFGTEDAPYVGEMGVIKVEDPETGEENELTYKRNYVRLRDSSQVDGTLITEVKQGRDGVSVKLADSMKALAWLSDYFRLNPKDKHRIEYDRRRLELEEKRINMLAGDDGDERPIEIRVVRPGEAVSDDGDEDD